MRCCLCAVLFFATALVRGQAAPVSLAEFPFEFREGFLWIKVNVPQSKKPLNFLVDTGAGVCVINLSTAKRIGLKLGREVVVHGVQTMLTGYWQERMCAKVGDVELPRGYLAVDLDKLSSSCERPVDGLAEDSVAETGQEPKVRRSPATSTASVWDAGANQRGRTQTPMGATGYWLRDRVSMGDFGRATRTMHGPPHGDRAGWTFDSTD